MMQHVITSGAWLGGGALLLMSTLLSGCPGSRETQSEQAKSTESKASTPAQTPTKDTSPPLPVAAKPTGDVAAAPKADPPKPDKEFMEAAESELPAIGAVSASALNLRSGSGTSHGVLRIMRCGEALRVTGREGTWYKVETFDKNGWASASFINLIDAKKGGTIPRCQYDNIKLAQVKPAPAPKVPTPSPIPVPPPAEKDKEKTLADKLDPHPEPKVVVPPPGNNTKGREIIFLSKAGEAEPVRFAHHNHNVKFNCVRCHHGFTEKGEREIVNAKANEEKSCHACHKKASVSPVKTQKAFHQNCIPCHEAKGVPHECGDCHNRANL